MNKRGRELFKILFILLMIFINLEKGFCQLNTVKLTPLNPIWSNMHIEFERQLTRNWTGNLDMQFWFLNKENEIHETSQRFIDVNEGFRNSISLRYYFYNDDKNKLSNKCYIGFGTFTGQHHVEKTNLPYEIFILVTNDSETTEIIETTNLFHGEINLLSRGVFIPFGGQFIVNKKIIIDLNLIAGRSWINYNENHFFLYQDNSSGIREIEGISKYLNGFFIIPKFSLGINF